MKMTYQMLDSQLAHARAMMVTAGCPGLRLTRSCDDDRTLARAIEGADPFNARPTLHVEARYALDYALSTGAYSDTRKAR